MVYVRFFTPKTKVFFRKHTAGAHCSEYTELLASSMGIHQLQIYAHVCHIQEEEEEEKIKEQLNSDVCEV